MSNDDLELDFFSAMDAETRADAYATFEPARAERRVFAVIAGVLAVGLSVGYLLMPEAPTGDAAKTGAQAAASAAAVTGAPVSAAPASAAPASLAALPAAPSTEPALANPTEPTSRLRRLLQRNASVAGAAPSPPAAAPAPTHDAARARIEAGEFDAALTLLADAPESFDRAALRGWALYELGRDADARVELRAALERRPDHAESLLLLGSLEQARDSAAAEQTYRAFLTAHPKAPQADEVRQILERIGS